MQKKRSFFERLTGGVHMDEDTHEEALPEYGTLGKNANANTSSRQIPGTRFMKEEPVQSASAQTPWQEEEAEGQLSVDVYQTPGEIIVQSMVAGVRPEDLVINITRDMITIRGKREENRAISEDNYFTKELYWGSFSRTILLPQEIDPEEAEAIEKHGLLIIKLPKLDKGRQTSIKVKSL